MKAPDKIKIGKYNITSDGDVLFSWVTNEPDCEAIQHDIEYIRKDAFIEKVINFLNYKLDDGVEIRVPGTIIPSLISKKEFIEEFTNYIKGE